MATETKRVCNAIRRRWTVLGYAAAVVAVAILVSASPSSQQQPESAWSRHVPRLIIDDSVASDFQALAEETWARFLTVFQARTDCFGDVRLRATRTLSSRAAYDPDSATVTVRVPGTRAMLQEALVHEWAHHIEFQCDEHQGLRRAFLVAQRLPPDMPWRPDDAPASAPGNVWADIPSEQYAEATIELILGRRQIPTGARITREAVHVVAVWAAGD
jgi:hypothetical protein